MAAGGSAQIFIDSFYKIYFTFQLLNLPVTLPSSYLTLISCCTYSDSSRGVRVNVLIDPRVPLGYSSIRGAVPLGEIFIYYQKR